MICKNTESNIGPIELIGINSSPLITLSKKPLRKIECFGNSITCGTGSDMSEVACGKGRWEDQHNAYMSYGALVARKFNAQWQLSSYSGIGLIHSCCNMDFTMPDAFDKIGLKPGTPIWDFKNYTPDIVTICLGQNDGIQDSTVFCSAYVKFIQTLRTKYPQAQIICITSPMANEALRAAMKSYLTGVELYMKQQADTKVHTYFFSKSWNNGCDAHPSMAEHQEIADELEGYIAEIMGW